MPLLASACPPTRCASPPHVQERDREALLPCSQAGSTACRVEEPWISGGARDSKPVLLRGRDGDEATQQRRRRGCGLRRRGASMEGRPDLASSSRHAESAIDGGQARPRLLQPSRGITPPWRKQTVMRLRRRGSGLEWRRGAATLESGGLVEGRDGAARHGATVDGG
ncbi:Os08g0499600 [Oryza sativa Japonica Group]|uniref:Os08g0499600 protein n=1 Tax=Oryza sativa subsp. japonica TaxID=39947 RepID=A0A0P0XH94_ORYSJ|nr:Os08g0499600 [Oryza sativa Japonica Group]